jgi:putative ABC transport system substrate-binding protein
MLKKSRKTIITVATCIVLVILLAMSVLSTVGCSQKPKTYKIGVISGHPFFMPAFEGFKEKLTALGYKEGDRIIYDVADLNVDMDAYEQAAKKFVADKVDLIFSYPTEATQIAKKVTEGTNIPVVFTLAIVEDTDIINSLREPGGNITVVRFPSVELSSRRFDVLMQVKPSIKKLFVPVLEGYPSVPYQSKSVAVLAKQAGVTIEEVGFTSPDELTSFLDKRKAQKNIGMDAILCYAEPISITPPFMSPVIAFAQAEKIPISGVFLEGGPSVVIHVMLVPKETGELAATLADKIFNGTAAGTIPVLTPEIYLKIDYALAQKIGLTIPEKILKQATEIIR